MPTSLPPPVEAARDPAPEPGDALQAAQARALALLATGAPLAQVFGALLGGLESALPGARCAVLVVDPAAGMLRHLAAPSLPRAYAEACAALPIGPRVGSCGAAAWHRERVVVPDVRRSLAFVDFLPLTDALGSGRAGPSRSSPRGAATSSARSRCTGASPARPRGGTSR